MGHLKAGKTTLINRILNVKFNMRKTESTNGIVIIKKGGIRLRDGKWINKSYDSGMIFVLFDLEKTLNFFLKTVLL